jgi:hypothetical protein
MNFVSNSAKNGLTAAVLVVVCAAQVSLAGYKNGMNPTNTPSGPGFVGSASASLGYSLAVTNVATTPNNVKFNPSAGVSVSGTWTATNSAPGKSPAGCTSQIYINPTLPGGPKVVTYASTPSGAAGNGSADPSPELADRLAQDGFVLVPNPCGAGYNVASGDEVIDNQHYLVVLGTSSGGTAHWFRGYFFNGTGPTNRDQVINEGTKLYDVVVTGPFDFGDPNSTDRCKALKIPINYTGPYLYLIADGTSISTTTLAFTDCPDPNSTYTIPACNPSYPVLHTSGGCGTTNIAYSPAFNTLPLDTPVLVTVTAMDAGGNDAQCTFTVIRPSFRFTNCPQDPYSIPCGSSVVYPTLLTTGGCGTVNITFSQPATTLGPGITHVIATATDANHSVTTCGFDVVRPYLNLGSAGFGSPVNGPGGSCNPPAPTAVVKGAGNNVPIKFTAYLCNSPYSTGKSATVTIRKFDANCQPTIELTGIQLSPTSATYHWQWKTLASDVGFFQISVNLNDGNPNPNDPQLSAVVQLTP